MMDSLEPLTDPLRSQKEQKMCEIPLDHSYLTGCDHKSETLTSHYGANDKRLTN